MKVCRFRQLEISKLNRNASLIASWEVGWVEIRELIVSELSKFPFQKLFQLLATKEQFISQMYLVHNRSIIRSFGKQQSLSFPLLTVPIETSAFNAIYPNRISYCLKISRESK